MNTTKIVVGVDGSLGSDAALEWAIHQASTSDAEIVAVHAVQQAPPLGTGVPVANRVKVDSERWWSHAYVQVQEQLCRLLKASRIAHRIVITSGHPATEILRVADDEDAALIVVGNGLHSSMTELFLGTVAHELSHHARRPLVIVPAHEGEQTRVHEPSMAIVGVAQRRAGRGTLVAHDHVVSGVSPTMLTH